MQILPSLNSKAFFSRSAHFSCCANISVDADILPGTKDLKGAEFLPNPEFSPGAEFIPSAEFSPDTEFLPSAEISLDAGFLPSAEFSLNDRFLPSAEILPSAEFLLDANVSVYFLHFYSVCANNLCNTLLIYADPLIYVALHLATLHPT